MNNLNHLNFLIQKTYCLWLGNEVKSVNNVADTSLNMLKNEESWTGLDMYLLAERKEWNAEIMNSLKTYIQ